MYLEKKDLPKQLQHLHSAGLIRLEPTTQVSIPADAGTWSGGTRRIFSALELASGRAASITDTFAAPWDASRAERTVALKPGFAVVETGSFCGKPAGLRIYAMPQDLAPLLPALPFLTAEQHKVLDVIAGLKSAYRESEYARRGLTPTQVQQAKASLAAAGLIDSRGAVTVKGRNARASSPTV